MAYFNTGKYNDCLEFLKYFMCIPNNASLAHAFIEMHIYTDLHYTTQVPGFVITTIFPSPHDSDLGPFCSRQRWGLPFPDGYFMNKYSVILAHGYVIIYVVFCWT